MSFTSRKGKPPKPTPPTPITPPAPPIPPVPPIPPPSGYQILAKMQFGTDSVPGETYSYLYGAMAINFDADPPRIRLVQPNTAIADYQLPDESLWDPDVLLPMTRSNVIAPWYINSDPEVFPAGMIYWGNDWWLISKKYYDSTPPATTTIWPESNPSGGAIVLPLGRQHFAGFIKGLPGDDPLIGAGGIQSGQGSASGCTIAEMDGTVHVTFGYGSLVWGQRGYRPPNYYPINHSDAWYALEPRGDPVEGQWAADRVRAGGVIVGSEIWMFPWIGIGEISYAVQNELLTTGGLSYSQSIRHRFDATTYAFLGYDYMLGSDAIQVTGQDQDSSGRVYLAIDFESGSAVNKQLWVYGTPPPPTPPALLTNLITYLKMDEGSGSATDSKGSNTLAPTNAPGTGTGKINGARDFEASSNQYFSIASNASLVTGDINFTVACWVQLESKTTYRVIMQKGNGTSDNEYSLYYDQPTDRFKFYVEYSGGNLTVAANNLGSPALATWYYIVAWHNASGNSINIQVNGGSVNSSAYSNGVKTTTQPFYLGTDNAGSPFDGLIDEVGFWKRVLTSTERTALYNSGNGLAYGSFT